MDYYTMLWRQDTWRSMRDRGEGGDLQWAASNLFTKRGVSAGDRVFVVGTHERQLILIGALTVDSVTSSPLEVRARSGAVPSWPAKEYVLAAEGTGTPLDFSNVVALPILRSLQFGTPNRSRGLVFQDDGRLDQQTLRGVRKLTPASGLLLEGQLGRPT
jgi:hypothetical protein